MKKRLLVSFFCGFFFSGSVLAGGLIEPASVDRSSIKTYEFKGSRIDVSSDVPERFFGTYDSPESRLRPRYNPESNWRQFARKIRLNSDGTGYIHLYGRNQPKKKFEWGFVTENGRLMVGRYSYKDMKNFKVHTMIYKYPSGNYGYRYVYEHEGQVAIMPFGVPVRVPMLKD